jgi:hypothetical protein
MFKLQIKIKDSTVNQKLVIYSKTADTKSVQAAEKFRQTIGEIVLFETHGASIEIVGLVDDRCSHRI